MRLQHIDNVLASNHLQLNFKTHRRMLRCFFFIFVKLKHENIFFFSWNDPARDRSRPPPIRSDTPTRSALRRAVAETVGNHFVDVDVVIKALLAISCVYFISRSHIRRIEICLSCVLLTFLEDKSRLAWYT